MCITDENEVYGWGKNLLETDSETTQQFYDEPILLFKVMDSVLLEV